MRHILVVRRTLPTKVELQMTLRPQDHVPSTRQGAETAGVWRIGTLTYSMASLAVLFLWLLAGDFVWNARERAVTPLTQVMLKNEGISDTVVGLLVGSLPAALGMLVSPVVGYKSDRFRSRLGRRIPFLLVSTPIAALSMAELAFAPVAATWIHQWLGVHSPGRAVCFLGYFVTCWISFEVAVVTGNNLFLALINDVVPAEVIGRFFGLFRVVSLAVGTGFNFFLLGKAEAHMTSMFLTLATIYGAGFLLMCLRVKEGAYPPAPDAQGRPSFIASVNTYFRECFFHRYYLWIFGVSTLAAAAFTPLNTFSIFYAKSVGLSLDQYGKVLSIAFVASLLLSYPIGALADRFHPLRVAIGSMLLYIPLCLWGAIYAKTPDTYALGFFAHVVISGVYFTGTASLGQRLYQKGNFAQFAAAAQIVLGLCAMMLTPVAGILLDWNGHHYPLTFVVGGVLTAASIGAFFVVLTLFLKLGGDAVYRPPQYSKPSQARPAVLQP